MSHNLMSVPKSIEKEAFDKLRALGQEGLLHHIHTLSQPQKYHLLQQIALIDISLFKRQQAEISASATKSLTILPFEEYAFSGRDDDIFIGEQMIKEGKGAVVVLAGGQGSRLRCSGPKGCCHITPFKKKSLYQLLAEKVKAASLKGGRPLHMAVMTSPLNDTETKLFFSQNAFFGLDSNSVAFFVQEMWPLMSFTGDLLLEEADQIGYGPNGNGSVFRLLVKNGIWEKWHQQGIQAVSVIPVDNPLALPFDFELFGFHQRNHNSVSIKSAFRKSSKENVGVLAKVDGRPAIIEYIDLDLAQRAAVDQKGKLRFGLANLGLYCFSMDFIKQASELQLPLHKAKKAVKMLYEDASVSIPEGPNAWKFEEFIFDVFPFADRVQALIFTRENCFAPLKNLKGEDSIETVRAALLAFDRQTFAKVTGQQPPVAAFFELAPQFYYPTLELQTKWWGKALPEKEYVDD